MNRTHEPSDDRRDPVWWQLPLVLVVSLLYEALFVRTGVNFMDEGWPLYAAMQLQTGGTLYRDVFWVFPPGALLPAWLGRLFDPPGLLLARYVYVAFTASLCGAIYLLGRRLMTSPYALLAGLLVAVAAPHSHLVGVVFGYRYLIFSVLALLCFAARLRTNRLRWTVLAGCLTGVALLFRLTPAFAVSMGITTGIMVAGGPWRRRLEEALGFAAGLLLVAAPVVLHLGSDVGFGTLWTEVVVRPVAMTRLQSLPVPVPSLPAGLGRWQIEDAFADLEFWLYPLLFLGYGLWLGARSVRRLREGKGFEDALLLATVIWGAVFLLRSYGRADVFHLESAIPPVCLLLAHLTYLSTGPASPGTRPGPARRRADALRLALVLGTWVVLKGVDLYADPEVRGQVPVDALDGRIRAAPVLRAIIDQPVDAVRRLSEPGDVILDLSASPLYHPLTDRPGPGGADVVMPGTFLDESEEAAFVARLEARPPEVVLVPRLIFDGRPERAPWAVAPRLFQWIRERYVLAERLDHFDVLTRAP